MYKYSLMFIEAQQHIQGYLEYKLIHIIPLSNSSISEKYTWERRLVENWMRITKKLGMICLESEWCLHVGFPSFFFKLLV